MATLTIQDWKDIASIAQSVATALSLLVAAAWVYFRYVRNAENRSNVSVRCAVDVLGQHDEHWIVQITAEVINKGRVPYRIEQLEVTLRSLNETDPIEFGDPSRNHLKFGSAFYTGSFIGKSTFSIVDPGTEGKYFQIVPVATNAKYLFAFVSLRAPGTGLETFNAERTVLLSKTVNPQAQPSLAK